MSNLIKQIRPKILDNMAGHKSPWYSRGWTIQRFMLFGFDGCTRSPDGWWWDKTRWLEACLQHDYEYHLLRGYWLKVVAAPDSQKDGLKKIWKQHRHEADKNLRKNIRYCSSWSIGRVCDTLQRRPFYQRASGALVGFVYCRAVRRLAGPAAR